MITVTKRSFDALKWPKGSNERDLFNANSLTSEYYPSKKYTLTKGERVLPFSYRTKNEAIEASKWIN